MPVNKKPPKKEIADTVATGIRLRKDTVEWLRSREGGVTGGIKEAIERLMIDSTFDAPTRALADDLKFLAYQVEQLVGGAWHKNPTAYEALLEAIRTWMENARPAIGSDATSKTPDDPHTLGRVLAKVRLGDREAGYSWKEPEKIPWTDPLTGESGVGVEAAKRHAAKRQLAKQRGDK